MSQPRITPALSASEWTEWRVYKASLARTVRDPQRAAIVALQTMARNNDLLPADSPHKITHKTVHDLRGAAECLEKDGKMSEAESTRAIAFVLEATLGPAE